MKAMIRVYTLSFFVVVGITLSATAGTKPCSYAKESISCYSPAPLIVAVCDFDAVSVNRLATSVLYVRANRTLTNGISKVVTPCANAPPVNNLGAT
jgi:hypothetical protein